LPDIVAEYQTLFDNFTATSHYILKYLLEAISTGIGLSGELSLQKHHRDDEPSKSSLYFLHYPISSLLAHQNSDNTAGGVGQNSHTDIGTLTLLFAPQWGLQAMSPVSGEWEWIRPLPGHAIINVGDTLRFLSNFQLRSALHRAVPIEGIDRYAISYFLRASDSTEFTKNDNKATNAKDWCTSKYDTYEEDHETQLKRGIADGGMTEDIQRRVKQGELGKL
jgi:isopenicillin N synthase-like dioxygenase